MNGVLFPGKRQAARRMQAAVVLAAC